MGWEAQKSFRNAEHCLAWPSFCLLQVRRVTESTLTNSFEFSPHQTFHPSCQQKANISSTSCAISCSTSVTGSAYTEMVRKGAKRESIKLSNRPSCSELCIFPPYNNEIQSNLDRIAQMFSFTFLCLTQDFMRLKKTLLVFLGVHCILNAFSFTGIYIIPTVCYRTLQGESKKEIQWKENFLFLL